GASITLLKYAAKGIGRCVGQRCLQHSRARQRAALCSFWCFAAHRTASDYQANEILALLFRSDADRRDRRGHHGRQLATGQIKQRCRTPRGPLTMGKLGSTMTNTEKRWATAGKDSGSPPISRYRPEARQS